MRLRRAKPFKQENRAAQNPNFDSIFLYATYWFTIFSKHESCSLLSLGCACKISSQFDQCNSSYTQNNVRCQNCRWSQSVLSTNFGPIFPYALYWFSFWSKHKNSSLINDFPTPLEFLNSDLWVMSYGHSNRACSVTWIETVETILCILALVPLQSGLQGLHKSCNSFS